MEKFEETALQSAPKEPVCWLRYVDATFVIWSHGEEERLSFLAHLGDIHHKIQFTIEKEACGQLAFLDVLVTRRDDRRLTQGLSKPYNR